MIVLTFSEAEEEVLARLLDSLKAMKYEQIEISVEPPLTVEGLILHPQEARIEYGGRSRFLGPQQFAILYLLARNPGRTFRKSQIYSLVWERTAPIHIDETLRYHISEIRKVLLELTGREYIETVRRIGYRFREIKTGETGQL